MRVWIAAALAALLWFAGPAAAAPAPLRLWSVSQIEQGTGKVLVARGAQRTGDLDRTVDLGPVAFNLPLPEIPLPDRAAARVFSVSSSAGPLTADGTLSGVLALSPALDPFARHFAKGAVAHLDAYETYRKRKRGASLEISIPHLSLATIDANGPLEFSECLAVAPCRPIRAVLRLHVRAYAPSGGRAFFDVGGAVFTEGHQHAWFVGAATTAGSRAPFWTEGQFNVNGDLGRDRSGSRSGVRLEQPVKFTVPLRSVARGALFAVHVTLDAEAIDDRGRESAAEASLAGTDVVEDSAARAARLAGDGLERRGAPAFKEPPATPRPAARCPAGRLPRSGTVQLGSKAFSAGEASGTPLVLVTRTGGSRGPASVLVEARGGSARAGQDFARRRTLVRFEKGDASPRLVEIPIREDAAVESPEELTVSLRQARCARLGARRRATVTILDDDQAPPPPPPAFTIGGAVDGLVGSGLVLSNLGAELPVSANGSFTFPGTAAAGQIYEVNVTAQPPDQVCNVQHGTGHVGSANVTDIAVHCATLAVPSGLDTTFGRVSTPVGGGQGEALVLQPGGGIVTVGWLTAGDFALTRHDASGHLDRVVRTDLGGARDRAYDAALTPDGGIVAVGETDAAGPQKQDFGVVRYFPDGTPDADFGVVRTDFSGRRDVANAVAVQGDGKIVAAGFTASGIHSDFALARYLPDGTPDPDFGDAGLVRTDFGALSDDDVRALAIQPDGRIVAAGTAGEDIALARYLPDGKPDPTFSPLGHTTTNLGFVDVANGVLLTPGGGIVIAGHTVGRSATNDFLLAGFRSDGTLNPGFGQLGAVTTDLSGGEDFAENLTLDDHGRIVVVGRATSPTIFDLALARYTPDGTLDTSFADHGILTADFHGLGEFGQDLGLDAAGRIVAAGYTADGADLEFALLRAAP